MKGISVTRSVPDLQLAKNLDWILDIQQSPNNQNHVLIVTSSRLFMLEIRPSPEDSSAWDSAIILVSWVHFRNPQDTSLSMCVIVGNTMEEEHHLHDCKA